MSCDPRPRSEDWDYTLEFGLNPLAPTVARRALRLILDMHGVREVAGEAGLLAAELVTNSHRHAPGPAFLSVRRHGERGVRVSVFDTNSTLPALDADWDQRPDAEYGRGLGLIDRCADKWGGVAIGEEVFGLGGKAIWFELAEEGRDGA
ncbi:ATP-binding protein [Streptomyces zagrosensis]|uniref:Anti-sigma regulatory factor (Ser/Thr protein kinase) n=1 Tax=Streptomyces zagrosensis TaxID=1042984 RepID=A0A7W9V207_9ACTN|nr:ATP-binding protein [Streptomyces zagrosensis]MBB5938324.1 anti-sigma regulatory factor (Ser/Thr protein kinase) [Streptomyces zagrosensis]